MRRDGQYLLTAGLSVIYVVKGTNIWLARDSDLHAASPNNLGEENCLPPQLRYPSPSYTSCIQTGCAALVSAR